jgi:glutaryl-CoA dehydrogenase
MQLQTAQSKRAKIKLGLQGPSGSGKTYSSLLIASGLTSDYSPLRHANNLESVLTYEGTHEMHLLTIGKGLTGIPAFK